METHSGRPLGIKAGPCKPRRTLDARRPAYGQGGFGCPVARLVLVGVWCARLVAPWGGARLKSSAALPGCGCQWGARLVQLPGCTVDVCFGDARCTLALAHPGCHMHQRPPGCDLSRGKPLKRVPGEPGCCRCPVAEYCAFPGFSADGLAAVVEVPGCPVERLFVDVIALCRAILCGDYDLARLKLQTLCGYWRPLPGCLA